MDTGGGGGGEGMMVTYMGPNVYISPMAEEHPHTLRVTILSRKV